MLRTAGHVADDRGIDIAIAEFRTDQLVALALLDVGDGAEDVAGLGAGRRIVANVRAPQRAPLAPAERRIARGADIALADLPALDLVGFEQVRPSPAAKRCVKLPR